MPDVCCLKCGKPINGATGIECDKRPKPLDFSVCIYCAHVAIYRDDLTLREPTLAEQIEIFQTKEVIAGEDVIRRLNAKDPH
jgi:hypothetical protein